MTTRPIEFHDTRTRIGVDDSSLLIAAEQYIPDEFLKHLADARYDSVHSPAGEFHRVCSIPVAVVDKWSREGFNIHQESIHAIISRLKREGLDGLMATNKRI